MNDDEMAKAAVLLAHAPPDAPMPKHLERRILQSVSTPNVRATTTRSAVVELAAARPTAPPSILRELAPWCLAAACFAFAVFEWRSASVLAPPPAASASAAPAIGLLTETGSQGATFAWGAAERTGSLRIDAQVSWQSSAPFERRSVWARSSEGIAVALASQVCAGRCAQSGFWTVTSAVPLREPLDIWVTAAPSDGKVDLEKPTLLLSTRWPRGEE